MSFPQRSSLSMMMMMMKRSIEQGQSMNPIIALVLRGILITLIYLFVGWIGYTIFSELGVTLRKQAPTLAPRIMLNTIVEQKDYEKTFNQLKLTIGRDPDCDFSIRDETISLRHCQLSYHHKQWWAHDLNSTNGSYLNSILIDSPIVITDGDVLRLGNVIINIQINS